MPLVLSFSISSLLCCVSQLEELYGDITLQEKLQFGKLINHDAQGVEKQFLSSDQLHLPNSNSSSILKRASEIACGSLSEGIPVNQKDP